MCCWVDIILNGVCIMYDCLITQDCQTPLSIARSNGHGHIVQLLLEASTQRQSCRIGSEYTQPSSMIVLHPVINHGWIIGANCHTYYKNIIMTEYTLTLKLAIYVTLCYSSHTRTAADRSVSVTPAANASLSRIFKFGRRPKEQQNVDTHNYEYWYHSSYHVL